MYQALYRKYRPITFSDVVGQPHITKTLARQIETGQFSHAYLFCGTRGTGKTSCAKIFARAVNCLDPKNGDPCNECAVCKGILDGSIYDVVEIDAASNNSVDNVRQLRDEIVFTPVSTKYKVYIIDEVHMLSPGAFNALLKTLEEPPSHAIFILATTEAHKVPATILSRCQRFDFFRLTPQVIADRIKKILSLENRTLSDSSVSLIADLADGAMRDALSLLDKVLESDCEDDIERILGVIGRKTLYSLADAVAKGDADALYAQIADMYAASKDLSVLCKEMLSLFRELTVVKTTKNYAKTLGKSDADVKELEKIVEGFSVDRLIYCTGVFSQTLQNLSRSPDKRAEVEIAFLKAARPSLDADVKSLTARIDVLEKTFANGVQVAATPKVAEKKAENLVNEPPVKKTPPPKKEIVPEYSDFPPLDDEVDASAPVVEKKEEENASSETTSAPAKVETAPDGDDWQEMGSWQDVAYAVEKDDMFLAMTLHSNCAAVWKGREIKILCDSRYYADVVAPESKALIEKALKACRKEGYSVSYEEGINISKYVSSSSVYTKNVENGYFVFEDGDEDNNTNN